MAKLRDNQKVAMTFVITSHNLSLLITIPKSDGLTISLEHLSN